MRHVFSSGCHVSSSLPLDTRRLAVITYETLLDDNSDFVRLLSDTLIEYNLETLTIQSRTAVKIKKKTLFMRRTLTLDFCK